jgi:hypothetical protein
MTRITATAGLVVVVVIILLVLAGCVQPYPAESKSMGTQPLCLFFCLVTQTTIEDNRADTFTPTVGSSATGGSRSRSTVVEDSPDSTQY